MLVVTFGQRGFRVRSSDQRRTKCSRLVDVKKFIKDRDDCYGASDYLNRCFSRSIDYAEWARKALKSWLNSAKSLCIDLLTHRGCALVTQVQPANKSVEREI